LKSCSEIAANRAGFLLKSAWVWMVHSKHLPAPH